MIRYLLDTNAVVDALRDSSSTVARRSRRQAPGSVGLPCLVHHELHYGALKSSRSEAELRRIQSLAFPVLELLPEDAEAAAEIRLRLVRSGQNIGAYDLLIAAQAQIRKLTLVTRNLREFTRVPELKIEDWSVAS